LQSHKIITLKYYLLIAEWYNVVCAMLKYLAKAVSLCDCIYNPFLPLYSILHSILHECVLCDFSYSVVFHVQLITRRNPLLYIHIHSYNHNYTAQIQNLFSSGFCSIFLISKNFSIKLLVFKGPTILHHELISCFNNQLCEIWKVIF
jgi:hypothetical protein